MSEKRHRVITNRLDEKTYEAIEQDDNGFLYWRTEEEFFEYQANKLVKKQGVGGCFPVQLWFVEDFFHKMGRVLDVTKLKVTPVADPYAVNC